MAEELDDITQADSPVEDMPRPAVDDFTEESDAESTQVESVQRDEFEDLRSRFEQLLADQATNTETNMEGGDPTGIITVPDDPEDHSFLISVDGENIVISQGSYFSIFATRTDPGYPWTTQRDDFDSSTTGWSGQTVPSSDSLYFYLKRVKAESAGLITSSTVTAATGTDLTTIQNMNDDNTKVWIIGQVDSDKSCKNFRCSDVNETLIAGNNDSPSYTPPIGIIDMWNGTTPPTGWALCDGGTYNGTTTPDLRGRFIVGYRTGSPSDPLSAYAIGNYGGHVWHGATENNHNDHDLSHNHTVTTRPATYCAGNITTTTGLAEDSIYTSSGANWDGSDSVPATVTDEWQQMPVGALAKHHGFYNGNLDTDNRPPYYCLAYIMYVGTS